MVKIMFEAIKLLKQKLPENNQLMVTHSGHSWKASFHWFEPASEKRVQIVNERLRNQLPSDYIEFLTQISNGAILFYDVEYGQWGFRIYGTEELVEKQVHWQNSIPADWYSRFIAFCELYGEASVMVFDISRPTAHHGSHAVVETDAIDPINDWPTASRSFHEWLDHLITAQGDKYWAWK